MSLRSRTASPALSDGELLSGAEEKANATSTNRSRDSKVNTSARPNGSSSRASHRPPSNNSTDTYFHSREVDGSARLPQTVRDRSRSPFRKDRNRSRSPYRPDRDASGEKRRRDDDHYSAKASSDPRRFKVHYEEKPGARSGIGYRSQRSYADLDESNRHDSRSSELRSGSDTHHSRDRSRSPYRPGKGGTTEKQQHWSHDRAILARNESNHRRGSPTSVFGRESALDPPHASDNAKFKTSLPQQPPSADPVKVQERLVICRDCNAAQTDEDSYSHASVIASFEDANQPAQQLSEAEIIEQRRKRREAIKARHKTQPGLLVQALEHNVASAPATPAHDSSGVTSEQRSPQSSIGSPQTPNRDSPPLSPAAFAVADDEELANTHHGDTATNDDEGPSAADYDPNMDMQEDRPDYKQRGKEADAVSIPQAEPGSQQKDNKDFDMFADDDDDDMFAPTDNVAKAFAGAKQAKTLDQSLLDNWDYPDGHYRIILGELLDNRYAVQQQIGKGTFATVVKAQDTKTGSSVAIKIAANNETMYKAGQKEMDFLKILNENDPDDKKHVIRLLRSFDHKGHMCIVFEALSADLREVLKKFGRNVGLNLKAIRSYAQQMFLSLSHMKKCQILHADLKPDNILVSERRNLLKICDLGTAAFINDTELTPYLVSRFYRAPEVILGMPFDYAIDMWSIGCTLFELYTGRILFAGADNNQMLRVIQECRGKIPIRMLKQSHPDQRERHFDVENNFFSQERDKITGKITMRQLNFKSSGEPGKDIRSRLSNNSKGLGPLEMKEHMAFVDLLDKCLHLDPARRISPNEALRHGFIAHAAQPIATTTAHRVVPAMGLPRLR
jgi:serine/threonine-protein kinase PRP4